MRAGERRRSGLKGHIPPHILITDEYRRDLCARKKGKPSITARSVKSRSGSDINSNGGN